MGSSLSWIIVSGLVLLFLVIFLVLIMRRKERPPTDYYTLFIMGLFWLAIGLPFKNYFLAVMGGLFVAVGLIHKSEWKKNREALKKWNKKNTGYYRVTRIALIMILAALVAAGIAVLIFKGRGL